MTPIVSRYASKTNIGADRFGRKKLIKEFQEKVWNSETPDEPGFEILSELAFDLDFYEPDEKRRREDFSYYGDERLNTEIELAIQKLHVGRNLRSKS